MKIIISPAKKMRAGNDFLEPRAMPQLLAKTKCLQSYLRSLSYDELKKLLCCSDRIAKESFRQFQEMNLSRSPAPALLSYDGIQYQYMAPQLFTLEQFEYAHDSLRILSGFYGLLKPFDGVVPYRLEMQAKCRAGGCKSLYDFWNDDLFRALIKEDDTILNLASAEYSRAVAPYAGNGCRFITASFCELVEGKSSKKGVYVKIARGEMVRWLAENHVTDPRDIKWFNRLGYQYSGVSSSEKHYVFVREKTV